MDAKDREVLWKDGEEIRELFRVVVRQSIYDVLVHIQNPISEDKLLEAIKQMDQGRQRYKKDMRRALRRFAAFRKKVKDALMKELNAD
jgi:tRNA U54 and U55 pseudouridine synthase Pus10